MSILMLARACSARFILLVMWEIARSAISHITNKISYVAKPPECLMRMFPHY